MKRHLLEINLTNLISYLNQYDSISFGSNDTLDGWKGIISRITFMQEKYQRFLLVKDNMEGQKSHDRFWRST